MQFSQGAEVDAGNGMGPDATLDAAMSVRVRSCIWFVGVQIFQFIVPDISARLGRCKGGTNIEHRTHGQIESCLDLASPRQPVNAAYLQNHFASW